jgi:hypothetical protein
MQGRPVRRVVALLSTLACCIALPATVWAAPDDAQPQGKSTKSTAKPSSSTKGAGKSSTKTASKSSSKPTGKSSKSSKTASKSSGSRGAAKKAPSKATASSKKPSGAPAVPRPLPATDSVRAAFDPASPTSTGIPGAPSATASASPPGQRGPTRIDFDDRLIQGQRNTAGAVYLYDRKELKQRSMIKKRESFREEIVGAVYDSEL